MEDEYKKCGDVSPTIENEERYTIPRPTVPVKNSTKTENDFDNIVLNIEVETYVERKSML